jgi:hypothetical protein
MPHTGGSAPRVLESRTSERGATRTTGIVKSKQRIKRINTNKYLCKKGCFVISKVTLWGYLMQKGKKKRKKLCFDAK